MITITTYYHGQNPEDKVNYAPDWLSNSAAVDNRMQYEQGHLPLDKGKNTQGRESMASNNTTCFCMSMCILTLQMLGLLSFKGH